jgi:hypothetical protein
MTIYDRKAKKAERSEKNGTVSATLPTTSHPLKTDTKLTG